MTHNKMSDERHDPDTLVNIAGEIVSQRLGHMVRLRAGKVLSTWGSIVIRCHLIDSPTDTPPTVIIKKIREDQFAYDPDSPGAPNSAHWIFNDWAAAQFLSRIPSDLPLSPLFYGGSREFGLIVLEDLGEGEAPNTYDALNGNDPAVAEQALIEHVSLIGQLHAATIGRAEEYRDIRSSLGPQPNPKELYQDPWSDARTSQIQRVEVDEAMRHYHAAFEALGVHPQAGVNDEIEFVTAAVEQQPGPFLAFCKGDQNLAGDYIRRNANPRLFDFGSGGLRHALIEGMPGRMTWGCMMRIPGSILPRMENAYQARLAEGYAEVSDDRLFHQSMAEAGARWNIFHVIHRLPDAFDSDRRRGPTTLRQQVIAWIEAFADLSEEYNQMRALGISAREMGTCLRRIWSAKVGSLPYYPAFR
jgi:hypothetical protein